MDEIMRALRIDELIRMTRAELCSLPYDEATKQLASQVAGAAQKAFGSDQGVGHAAGEVAKSVTKTATNPVGAAIDFGKQIEKGFR
jgi:hypothetical protein